VPPSAHGAKVRYMDSPVILAVDEDPDALLNIDQELNDRYARHYRVRALPSATQAREWLEELSTAGDEVALILAGQSLSELTGSDLLNEAHHLHPHAKRALLVEWGALGDRATGKAIFDSIAHGRIDHYLLKPSAPPDELFHNTISGLLLEWAEAQRAFPFTIRVVGESWSGRAYELRKALNRCAFPHAFWLADSSRGRAVVNAVGENAKLPLMVLPDGRVLQNPTNAEIALASGGPVAPEREDYDLVIVGAGPAGLSAAVYGASEGFNTLVVDDGGIGGQATSSSLIRNYLGFPAESAGGGWHSGRTSRRGYSVRASPLCSRSPTCGATTTGSRSRCRTSARCVPGPSCWPVGSAIAYSASPRSRNSMAPASSMADQRPKHPLWLTETSTSSAARTQPGRRPCIWHVMQRTSPWSCEPTRWPLVCPTI